MKFEGEIDKKIFRVASTGGIRECFQHYDTLSKEEYRKIIEQRVQQFVVYNKRIMNPVDDRDEISHFHTFWEGKKLLGGLRIIPPFVENWEGYEYPIVDRATIVDPSLSMLAGGSAKEEHCFSNHRQDLKSLYKSANSMLELYKEGHELMERFGWDDGITGSSRHRWIGMDVDKWDVPSYRWVHEEVTQQEWQERINPILH